MHNKRILPFQLIEKAEGYQTTTDMYPMRKLEKISRKKQPVKPGHLSEEKKKEIINRHEKKMAGRLHSTGMHEAAKKFERSFDDSDLVKGMENRRAMPENMIKGIHPEKAYEHAREIAQTSREEAKRQGMVKDPDDLESPETRFVTRRARQARMNKKSISETCDEIMEKAEKRISSLYTTPGALSSKKSGGYEGVKTMKELDKFKSGEKSDLDPKEKSYSMDFSKAIMERLGLEKGRKASWQKETKASDEDKEAMEPGRLMGDPGSREHERKRVAGIHASGREENFKRMAASGDKSDRAYAKKYGYE